MIRTACRIRSLLRLCSCRRLDRRCVWARMTRLKRGKMQRSSMLWCRGTCSSSSLLSVRRIRTASTCATHPFCVWICCVIGLASATARRRLIGDGQRTSWGVRHIWSCSGGGVMGISGLLIPGASTITMILCRMIWRVSQRIGGGRDRWRVYLRRPSMRRI